VELQERFQSKKFTVLAFPTNDFHQELGSNKEIQEFVHNNFEGITFPVLGLSKLQENPVYQALVKQMPQAHVKHNFYKFLVNRRGMAVKFYDKRHDPLTLLDDIEELLDVEDESTHHRLVTH